MAWDSISLFAGFLEKEKSLETVFVIFENVSPKGFFWLNMKNSKFQLWRRILDIYRQPLLNQFGSENCESVVYTTDFRGPFFVHIPIH